LLRPGLLAVRLSSWVALLAAAVACSSPAADTAVVVGIQSDLLSGAIDTLRVVTTLGGGANTDETVASTTLPTEVKVTPRHDDLTAVIGVEVYGFQGLGTSPAQSSPLLVRTAETHFVPGRTTLLRLRVEGQCLLGLPGGPPGAPSCTAPQTCIAASCQDDHVAAASLETYSADWAARTPDICKPLHAGTPIVQVGTGQSDYLPLTDGQTIQAEQGPQGGHHVWVAVRQENLKQSLSKTTITSVAPAMGLAGPRTAFVFTFDPDQGGFCKLAGLRYQLDADGVDYHRFLGQALDITVTIADVTGATGTGVAHVNIAPTVLCPSGTLGC
jgi:hypothetical protein